MTSARSQRVCANCSASDSRRTRDSWACMRASSMACARGGHPALGGQAPLLERAQFGVGVLQGLTRHGQVSLDLQAAVQRVLQSRTCSSCTGASPSASSVVRFSWRCVQLRALLEQPCRRAHHRLVRGASALVSDQHVAQRQLRRLRRVRAPCWYARDTSRVRQSASGRLRIQTLQRLERRTVGLAVPGRGPRACVQISAATSSRSASRRWRRNCASSRRACRPPSCARSSPCSRCAACSCRCASSRARSVSCDLRAQRGDAPARRPAAPFRRLRCRGSVPSGAALAPARRRADRSRAASAASCVPPIRRSGVTNDSPARQLAPPAQRLCQGVAGAHRGQHRHGWRRVRALSPPELPRGLRPRLRPHSAELGSPGSRSLPRSRSFSSSPSWLRSVNAHRLEVIAQHGLDGTFPTGFHAQCPRPRAAHSPCPERWPKPSSHALTARLFLAQRRLLHGLERHEFGPGLITARAQFLETLLGVVLLRAQLLCLGQGRGEARLQSDWPAVRRPLRAVASSCSTALSCARPSGSCSTARRSACACSRSSWLSSCSMRAASTSLPWRAPPSSRL